MKKLGPRIGNSFVNWNNSSYSKPSKIVEVRTVDQLREIIINSDKFPSPLRVGGSFHSMNNCFATVGTQILLKGRDTENIPEDSNSGFNFKGIDVNLNSETVTVGAAVNLYQIKEELKKYGKQIEVNPEIGNVTAGSLACCGTKDSSIRSTSNLAKNLEGWGQISSTIIALRMIDGNGNDLKVNDLDELRAIRSSYGLYGIIYEVTFKIIDSIVLKYDYKSIDLGTKALPSINEVFDGASGVLGFLLPYQKRIIVERRFVDEDSSEPSRFSRLKRAIRDIMWENGVSFLTTLIPFNYFFNLFDWLFNLFFTGIGNLGGYRARRFDSMTDYKFERRHFFDFTFWAIPVEHWDKVIPEFFKLCEEFEKETGFRMCLPTLIYFVKQDNNSLLSYSNQEDIFTMDLVDSRPNNYLWVRFNEVFNRFISNYDGVRPLLNQTKALNRSIVHKTLGTDWQKVLELRKNKYDPNNRFLNEFFYNLM